jgi:hypothetical protein
LEVTNRHSYYIISCVSSFVCAREGTVYDGIVAQFADEYLGEKEEERREREWVRGREREREGRGGRERGMGVRGVVPNPCAVLRSAAAVVI